MSPLEGGRDVLADEEVSLAYKVGCGDSAAHRELPKWCRGKGVGHICTKIPKQHLNFCK